MQKRPQIVTKMRRCNMEKEQKNNEEMITQLPPETALEESLARKKKKKNKYAGHLQKRNHFDAKDMILLVVMLIIIYGILTWVEFFAEEAANAKQNTDKTTIESMQESKTAEE